MDTTPTTADDRLTADTRALLTMLSQGGTLAGLAGLTERELEALYTWGQLQYRQGRWTEALKAFARLVTLQHGEPRYLNALASTHQQLGRHEQAVHYWGLSQLLAPRDPLPTFHSAVSLLALGHEQDALDALDLVLRQCRRQGGHAELAERAQALAELIQSRAQRAH